LTCGGAKVIFPKAIESDTMESQKDKKTTGAFFGGVYGPEARPFDQRD